MVNITAEVHVCRFQALLSINAHTRVSVSYTTHYQGFCTLTVLDQSSITYPKYKNQYQDGTKVKTILALKKRIYFFNSSSSLALR